MDIILIAETWLVQHGDELTIQNLTPHDFTDKSFPRPNCRGGGVAFIHKNILEIK